MPRSKMLDSFEEWLDGRHMPYIVDEDEEMTTYVVRHHENTWSYDARPIPAAEDDARDDLLRR